ncbi:MAG TPA: PAS domain S-box protein, partial [Spirochaetota bacterium]|nr:PAS domain S-box protein [Spirochaetota bacterium]
MIKKKILIVEDESINVMVLKGMLTGMGHEVVGVAETGREAIAMARGTVPDLVLMDIFLKDDVDGVEAAREINSFSSVPIIYVTAYSDRDTIERVKTTRSSACILKPYELQQLQTTIDIALHRYTVEKQLRESEMRYRSLFESSRDAVYIRTLEGRIIDCNEAMLSLFGYTTDEIMDLDVATAYVDVAVKDRLQIAITAQEAVRDFPVKLKKKDGSVFDCLITASLWRDGDGKILGIQGILHDVTEQKRIEDELRQAHFELKQLLDSISSIVISVSARDVVTLWNPIAESILSLPAHLACGRRFSTLAIPWEWDRVSEGITASITGRKPVRIEDVQLAAPDGSMRLLGIAINPITDAAGDPVGYLVRGADITERRSMEAHLAQAQKLEAIGQLAAGVAHEINTPLQYINSNLSYIRDGINALTGHLGACGEIIDARDDSNTDRTLGALLGVKERIARDVDLDEINKAVMESLDGVDRVVKIIRSMKELSHPGSEEMMPVDVNHAVENAVTVSRNEWKYVADLLTDYDANVPPVPCYLNQLNQAVLNIIINAAQAIAESLLEPRADHADHV